MYTQPSILRAALFMVSSVLIVCIPASANPRKLTICDLNSDWEHLLNKQLEIRGTIFISGEIGVITDQHCSFRFAFGDDYQTFGSRFRVKRDSQWILMRRMLTTQPTCLDGSIVKGQLRIVTARMRGTLIRSPRTGTIRQDEMPPEFVIRRVYEVRQPSIACPAT